MKQKSYLLKLLLCLWAWHAAAKNLGIMGETYPVIERDLRQVIQQRLLTLQQTGELEQLAIKLNQALQQQRDRPPPVSGLQRTMQPRTWLFDPSVYLPYVIKNANGEVVLPAGTRINPLTTRSLTNTLIFYNADDREQVRWVQRQTQQLTTNDKLILVGGSVASQRQLFKRPLFFDQGGRLTTRFQIKQVPARLTQQGHYLKIEEIAP